MPSPLAAPSAIAALPSADASHTREASGDQPSRGEDRHTERDPFVSLRTEVFDWLARHQDYPLAARRARIEGVVEIAAVIMPDGRLLDGRIVRSSGHRLLDRAALDLIARASPMPPPQGLEAVGQVELRLPIVYRMRL